MTMCPCGLKTEYESCCGVFISGEKLPATPEELMRSRYSAYSQANTDYIASTMKGVASKDFNIEDARQWARDVEWQGLDVLNASSKNDKGYVEFRAHLKQNNEKIVIHELSEFMRENGKWFYVDGKTIAEKSAPHKSTKTPRNEACPCGSGNKFKKCCGMNV